MSDNVNKTGERRRTASGLLVKFGSLLAAACAAVPVFACGSLLSRTPAPLSWMLSPLIVFLLSCAVLLVPARKARALVPLSVAAGAALSWLVSGGGLPGLTAGAVSGVLVLVFLSRRVCPSGYEWGSVFWLSALLWQPVLWALMRNENLFVAPVFRTCTKICAGSACLFVLLFLLYLNRMNLINGSHSDVTGRKVAFQIRSRNICAVLLLFALSAAAGFSSQLRDAAAWLWRMIKKGIAAVIRFIGSLFTLAETNEVSGGGGGGMDGLMAAEAAEKSLFAEILEKAVMVLAALILAFLLWKAAGAAVKAFKALYAALLARLGRLTDMANEDYTETVDDTRGTGTEGTAVRRHTVRQSMKRPAGGRELVRYLYRKFLRKNPALKGKTCREALEGEAEGELFAELYERARYSEHQVTEEESAELERRIGRIKNVKHM